MGSLMATQSISLEIERILAVLLLYIGEILNPYLNALLLPNRVVARAINFL